MEIPDFTDTENSGNIIKETRTSKRKNLNPEVDKKVVIPISSLPRLSWEFKTSNQDKAFITKQINTLGI